MGDRDIRFIRKNGRIIPIRAKRAQSDVGHLPAAIPAATVGAIVSGSGTYRAVNKYENYLNSLRNRMNKVIRTSTEHGGMYRNTSLKDILPRKKPSLFDWAEANKKLKRFETTRMRIAKVKPQLKDVKKTLKFVKRFKLRASIGAALIGGLAAGYSTYKDK